jgi:hypothetical protein
MSERAFSDHQSVPSFIGKFELDCLTPWWKLRWCYSLQRDGDQRVRIQIRLAMPI